MLPDLTEPPAWYAERMTSAATISDIVGAMARLQSSLGAAEPVTSMAQPIAVPCKECDTVAAGTP